MALGKSLMDKRFEQIFDAEYEEYLDSEHCDSVHGLIQAAERIAFQAGWEAAKRVYSSIPFKEFPDNMS